MKNLRKADHAALWNGPSSLRDFALEPEGANLLVFRAGEQRVCVRPSGTEPKLKVYLHARLAMLGDEPFIDAQARASALLDTLEARTRAVVAL